MKWAVDQACHVIDDILLPARRLERGAVIEVPADELDTTLAKARSLLGGTDQHGDVGARGEERFHQVSAHEPGATGDQRFHSGRSSIRYVL